MSKHDPKKKQAIFSAGDGVNNAENSKPIVEADLYNEALQILEANTEKLELYRKAKGLLEQILDYKDSQKLLEKCTDKISSITIANNEKKRKRNVLITIVSVIVGVIVIGLLVMSRSATVDSEKQSELEKAYSLLENAKKEKDPKKQVNKFNSAYEKFISLGDYKNAKYEVVLSKVERIKTMTDAGDYSGAISLYQSMAMNVLEGSDENIDGAHAYIEETIKKRAIETFDASRFYDALELFRYLDVESEEIAEYVRKCQLQAITSAKVGDVIKFGTYQTSVDNKSMKFDEDVDWIVAAKDGNKYLLVTENAILCDVYNTNDKAIEWKDSYLRTLLNSDEFINKMFNESEKTHIVTTENGESKDQVFILSKEEAEKYLSNGKMKTTGTPYAFFKGLEKFDEDSSCSYWLRDTSDCNALYVNGNGKVAENGYIANHISVGVRPAIWITVD